jgi:hypothetical protein
MKREIIEFIETLDACDELNGDPPGADCEILQQTAYVYLSTGQILECLKWSACGKIRSLFRRALRTIARR